MKKKHPEHVNLERWLVSYADFITLLFAFFVIMYAMSQSDSHKLRQVTEGLRKAFSSAGPVGMVNLGGNSGGNTINLGDNADPAGGRLDNLPAGKTHTAADPDPDLQGVRELLEETISLEFGGTEVSDRPQMQFDSRGLVVRVAAKDYFAEGEIEVRPDLRPVLDRIGDVLSKTNRLIRLEGHTDEGEKLSSRFSNHWEFSSARASWVANYWLKRFEFDPSRIGVAGYGFYRPLAKGSDPWKRAKNRRVEIIILNNKYDDSISQNH